MVPKRLQGVLWSMPVEKLDIWRDENYIVHQILAYGSWEDLAWLLKTYGGGEIRKEFVNRPAKDYYPDAFNFVKKVLLQIKEPLELRRYDRTAPRVIGRA